MLIYEIHQASDFFFSFFWGGGTPLPKITFGGKKIRAPFPPLHAHQL